MLAVSDIQLCLRPRDKSLVSDAATAADHACTLRLDSRQQCCVLCCRSTAGKAVGAVDVPESVIDVLTSLRDYLQDKCEPPIYVSDRRFMKALNLLQVAAYADGREEVRLNLIEDFLVIEACSSLLCMSTFLRSIACLCWLVCVHDRDQAMLLQCLRGVKCLSAAVSAGCVSKAMQSFLQKG